MEHGASGRRPRRSRFLVIDAPRPVDGIDDLADGRAILPTPNAVRMASEVDAMKKLLIGVAVCAAWSGPVAAQINTPNESGVAMGHVHMNVRDVEAHKKFWVELGATAVRVGSAEAVMMDGLLVVLREQAPTGPTAGSTINHFGVLVPQFAALRTHLDASGIKMDPARAGSGDLRQSSAYGPDEFRVELTEDPSLMTGLASHHLHYNVPDPVEVQRWYAATLMVAPGTRARWEAGDVPGMNLTYAVIPEGSPTPVQTKGRLLDHVGFEVTNLEAFARKLEASGVTLDTPYQRDPELGVFSVFLTDPWGVTIELTEGLRAF
jgi:catechol 2,3-dioxygenase-like lactoylglutathione lyase family enzyme